MIYSMKQSKMTNTSIARGTAYGDAKSKQKLPVTLWDNTYDCLLHI